MKRSVCAIIAIGLLLRIAYTIVIHDDSLLPYHEGDWTEYVKAAEQIANGDLSFNLSIFLVRPPVFPLAAAVLQLSEPLVIVANILISTCIIPATYVLARQLNLTHKRALVAALIIVVDPTSIKYSGVLLSDPIASAFLAFAFISLVACRKSEKIGQIICFGLLSGALIVLSSLTRPAAFLFWIPMALWIGYTRDYYKTLAIVGLVIPAALGIGAWKFHNQTVFGNSAFSSIGTFNLLYYRAAMVHYWAEGRENIDATYTELARAVEYKRGNDTASVGAGTRYRHRTPSSELSAIMTEVAIEVFRNNPVEYVLTIPVGLYRTLLKTEFWPASWIATVWNAVFLILSLIGLVELTRSDERRTAVFLFLPCAYFLGGTLFVQTSGIDTSARAMVTPLLAVMAVHGISAWHKARMKSCCWWRASPGA